MRLAAFVLFTARIGGRHLNQVLLAIGPFVFYHWIKYEPASFLMTTSA